MSFATISRYFGPGYGGTQLYVGTRRHIGTRGTSDSSGTLVVNKIDDHLDVVGTACVGAAYIRGLVAIWLQKFA